MGRELLGRSGMGQETLGEVRDGSRVSRGGPGRVKGPSVRSRMGRGPFVRSGTGWGTLKEVWYGSGDPRGVRDRSRDTSGRSRTGLGTPQGGLGLVEGR